MHALPYREIRGVTRTYRHMFQIKGFVRFSPVILQVEILKSLRDTRGFMLSDLPLDQDVKFTVIVINGYSSGVAYLSFFGLQFSTSAPYKCGPWSMVKSVSMLISDFAKATGLAHDTIRFYIGKGLLKPQRSAKGGSNPYHIFGDDDVTAARMIPAPAIARLFASRNCGAQ